MGNEIDLGLVTTNGKKCETCGEFVLNGNIHSCSDYSKLRLDCPKCGDELVLDESIPPGDWVGIQFSSYKGFRCKNCNSIFYVWSSSM
jgi:DNA-directed RNA polymerase subunit RPC12/RpoP